MEEKRVQLAVSLPFSDAHLMDRQSNIPLHRASNRQKVEQYVKALLKEIEACAMDIPEVRVHGIRFLGGPLHTLNEGQMERLLERLTGCFHLTQGLEILGLAAPGLFNTYPIRAMNRYGVAVMMDIPSFDREACQRHGIAFKGALSWTDLKEAGVDIVGIRTLKGLERRTQAQWALCARELLKRAPDSIEMMDGGVAQDAGGYAWFTDQLERAGYRQIEPDCFSRRERSFRLYPSGEFLGVGLAAASAFDGYYTQNTPDMEAYIAAGGSYDHLLVKAEKL